MKYDAVMDADGQHDADSQLKPLETAYQAGARMIPPLVYGLVFVAGAVLQHFFPITPPNGKFIQCIAALSLTASALLGVWSLFSFIRAGTTPLPIKPTTALVVTGPYRFVRNPMYLSLALLHLGLALCLGIIWALILLPLAIAIIRYRVIVGEEKYLEHKFGTAYLNYKASVPRWIPRLRGK